jgi:hypothetical protein
MNRYILGDLCIHDFLFRAWGESLKLKFMEACRLGHRELVILMIQKGADDWDIGLNIACQRGHRELVELMVQKGTNNWDFGLWGACEGGQRYLAELMIQKGLMTGIWDTK